MFKAPAGAAVAVVALLLSAWLLSNSNWLDVRDSLVAIAAGLLIYFAYRFARERPDRSEQA
jgi:divalent metal cation (Fe/Co/Zn/Cd) transporter